jgi:hypothetical protein
MFGKLSVVLIACAIAAPASFAGQQNGRDSVYATSATTSTLPSSGAVVTRNGRDSVYAHDAKPSTKISVELTKRFGRA